jgi:hypothetical protein
MYFRSPASLWIYGLLAAALIVIVGVPVGTRALFVRTCDLAASPIISTIQVNNKPSTSFIFQENASRPPAIKVKPFDIVRISVKLDSRPAGCQAHLSVDWALRFTVFNILDVKTESNTPDNPRIQIEIGEPHLNAEGEDPITFVVRDATGQAAPARIFLLQRSEE